MTEYSVLKKYYLVLLAIILFLAIILRVYRLDQVPPALFGDEVDVGYQAYSLLKTGKDISGQFLPFYIKSLAEFRAPLFIYSDVPFIGLFGLNEWGVRLSAAFWGIIGILGIYLLTKELFGKKVALIAALLLTISPWHLQYSRAAFEATMLFCFEVFGIYFFIKGFKKPAFFSLSAVLFALSFYIYSIAVVFTPLCVLLLSFIYRKELLKNIKPLGVAALFGLIILLPNSWSIYTGEARNRFGYVSIFQESVLLDKINIAQKNNTYYTPLGELMKIDPMVERIFHNKPTIYLQVFALNYLRAFSPDFLFTQGDPTFRHSIHEMGQLYYFDLILLVAGLLWLFFKASSREKLLIFGLLLIAPIPAGFTADGGFHATRLFVMLIPLSLILSLGAANLLNNIDKKMFKTGVILVLILALFNLTFYLHRYYIHYPVESWKWWHAGYKEALLTMKDQEKNYQTLVFNNTYEPSLIRFLFWFGYPPEKIQAQWRDITTEQKELEHFHGFELDNKYYFGSVENGFNIVEFMKPKMLYMLSHRDDVEGGNWEKEPPAGVKILKTIKNPQDIPIFYIGTKNP